MAWVPAQSAHDGCCHEFDAATWLIVPRIRVACPGCGPKLEALSWLAPYARVTRRLAEQVARLCAVLPINHVAAFLGVGWETVKAIDASHLEATLGQSTSPTCACLPWTSSRSRRGIATPRT